MRYQDLTPMQKAHICNGCGPKWSIVKAPAFIFVENCNRHDFGYWLGAPFGFRRIKRLEEDIQFLLGNLKDVEKQPKEMWSVYYKNAYRYFQAVRLFGWTAFNWGPMKTQEDLDRLTGDKNEMDN